MCARVCPTEELCEEVCVREVAEGKPVLIGQLQRYATDQVMAAGGHPFTRAASTGKTVGVVGAGPAGLAAAHRLAMLGHEVEIYDARPKGGGLNEYGIAYYKTVDGFAQAEMEWLLGIGGIAVKTAQRLGSDLSLDYLKGRHDAVVLALGLDGVNALDCPGADLPLVEDAVAFIEKVRQVSLPDVPVGRNVVVIGGGMTAIDAAVQARLLGAETVTIAYRRSQAEMGASRYEQDLAASKGVTIRANLVPVRIASDGITLGYTRIGATGIEPTGETLSLPADQILVAIGQALDDPLGLEREGRKIAVDGNGATSAQGVWAAGDCAAGGDDLTVTAVAEGRDVAEAIHRALGK
jgi:glutamate synthase (NADPH/NADH) small chain